MKKFEKKMRFSTCDLKYMARQSSHSDIINQRAELAQHILDCHAEIDRQSKTIKRQSRRLEKRSLILKAAQITSDVSERAIQSAESALHAKDEEVKEYNSLRSDLLNVVGSYDEDLNLFSTDMEIVDAIKKMVAQLPAERVWISSETHKRFPDAGVWFYVGHMRRNAAIKGIADELEHGKKYTLILPLEDFPESPKPDPQPLEVKVGKYKLSDGRDVEITAIDNNGRCLMINPSGVPWALTSESALRYLKSGNATFIGGGDDA